MTGKVNGAVNLSGTTSPYLTLPTGIVSGMTNFTVSAWVNVAASTAWMRVFDFGGSTTLTGTSGTYMFLTPSKGSGVRFAITAAGGGGEQTITSASPLQTGTWCHLAVTLSGSTGSLYVNGTLAGTNSAMTLNPSSLGITTNNYIGRSQYSGDPYLNGSVDEFRIYDRALSAGEVAALASGNASAPVNLVAAPGPQQIQVSWSPVANATSYAVAYAIASGGPYVTIASGLTTPTFTQTGLSYGTMYYYVVNETNITGTSPYSSELAATPQSALITPAEVNGAQIATSVKADNSCVATVTMNAAVAGHTYQVQYRTDLVTGTWTNIGNPQFGSFGNFTITLPATPPSARCFYRVVISR